MPAEHGQVRRLVQADGHECDVLNPRDERTEHEKYKLHVGPRGLDPRGLSFGQGQVAAHTAALSQVDGTMQNLER